MHPLEQSSANHWPVGPLVFIVLDGVGVGLGDKYDAVASAPTPCFDRLERESLHRTIRASGKAVGLGSDSDMGNSEVGHNTMGAGRIFDQGAKQVDNALESGSIWTGDWTGLVAQVREHHSTLHLIGLLSDGNVHSSLTHLFAIIDRANADGVEHLRVHVLLDGRDVPDFSALEYVDQLERHLARYNVTDNRDYAIASGGGRMVTTMDRYGANWGVVAEGWRAHVLGAARPFRTAAAAITTAREETPGVSDQDLPSFTVVDGDGRPLGTIEDGDAVLVFNFRGDRAIEISEALTAGEDFTHFDRIRVPQVAFAALSLYDAERGFPKRFLVRPGSVPGTMSEYLAESGVTQFAVAETQKFGHVTYFWNGNRSEKFNSELETYVEIPSDQVPFQTRPQMKSQETADEVIGAITGGKFRFIRANFAAGDMVGHTADLDATYEAITTIDVAVGRILDAVEAAKGCLVVTADHGNAEDMVQRAANDEPLTYADGRPQMKTSHSINPVEFSVDDFGGRHLRLRADQDKAGLSNVAATLIELLGFVAPDEYDASMVEFA